MKPSYIGRVVILAAFSAAALAVMQVALAEEPIFRDLTRKYFKDGDGSDLAKLVGYEQPVKKVIALEYKVLLFEGGKERPVDPKTYQFKVGDRIRVSIEPLSNYYVYIFHIGASGQSGFLLPATDEDPPLAKAGKPVALPGDGFFQFSEPPGEETLEVVAAEKPVPDRTLLARVLMKKPGEKDTPEEAAIRNTLKATRKKVLKSFAEVQKEISEHTVMWRGIAAEQKPMQQLAEDIRTRGVKEGTFEEPTPNGTSAVYMSAQEGGQPRLLVSIPLVSVDSKQAKTSAQKP
jgi:hypothetical protein